jgi:hypothetical protein
LRLRTILYYNRRRSGGTSYSTIFGVSQWYASQIQGNISRTGREGVKRVTQGNLANLNEEQLKQIDQLESQLGVILVAFDGYKPEDEQGNPQQ